ncbi:MAG: hypothetical protein ACLVO2_05510 [Clostridia bacterium]
MPNTGIGLNIGNYQMQVRALRSAGYSLETGREQPEMSGRLTALERLLEAYGELGDVVGKYRSFLEGTVGQLEEVEAEFIRVDASLLR